MKLMFSDLLHEFNNLSDCKHGKKAYPIESEILSENLGIFLAMELFFSWKSIVRVKFWLLL